jgi:hypothetical protein
MARSAFLAGRTLADVVAELVEPYEAEKLTRPWRRVPLHSDDLGGHHVLDEGVHCSSVSSSRVRTTLSAPLPGSLNTS